MILVKVLYRNHEGEHIISARVSPETFDKIVEWGKDHPPPLNDEDIAYICKVIREDPDAITEKMPDL